MKNKKLWTILAFLIVLVAIFIFSTAQKPDLENIETQELSSNKIKYVKIAGADVKVELALTPTEQARGLSGRSELKEGEGVLFVFDNPGIYSFWMKDMLFPIDIIWLAPSNGGGDSLMKVVYIKKDARPESYPKTFDSELEAKYILEVASGFSEKNNLQVGDSAVFTP